jgi:hypothetical protein
MHAVVVSVTINDPEAAETMLREQVVPTVKQAPGLVTAYWARSDEGRGGSMIVFESEEAASNAAEQLRSGPPGNSDAVTIDSIEVREVVAHL